MKGNLQYRIFIIKPHLFPYFAVYRITHPPLIILEDLYSLVGMIF